MTERITAVAPPGGTPSGTTTGTPDEPSDGTPDMAPDGDRLPSPRLALGRRTWQEIAHLLANLPVSIFGFVYVVTMVSTGSALAVTVVGLPLLAGGLLGARQLGKLERARARALLGLRIDEPSPLPVRRTGFFPGCGRA